MTNENKKTSDQLIFVHIFRKKHFRTNLENSMSESLNATSTPLNLRNFLSILMTLSFAFFIGEANKTTLDFFFDSYCGFFFDVDFLGVPVRISDFCENKVLSFLFKI